MFASLQIKDMLYLLTFLSALQLQFEEVWLDGCYNLHALVLNKSEKYLKIIYLHEITVYMIIFCTRTASAR